MTLSKEVLKGFPDVEYFDVTTREGAIVLRWVSVTPAAERLAKVRAKIQSLGLKEGGLEATIRRDRRSA